MKKSQNLFSNDRFHRVPHCRFPVFPPTGSWEAQHGVWRFSRWSWRADWQMLDSDAGRDWGQKEKGTTEDEMAGWHHQLDGHEFEWTPGAGDGQGGLACCNSWGRKELDTTERLNWTGELDGTKSQLIEDTVYSYPMDVVKEKSLWNSLLYFIHSSIQQYLINVHHMPSTVLNTGNAGGN